MPIPHDARQEILDLARVTQDALGGKWQIGTYTWWECTTASGDSGAAFSYGSQRLGQPLPHSAADTVERVREIWRQQGIESTVEIDDGLTPPNNYLSFPAFGTGTAPDGYVVQFTAADSGYADILFTSHCADGDAHDLDLAERVPTSGQSSDAD